MTLRYARLESEAMFANLILHSLKEKDPHG